MKPGCSALYFGEVVHARLRPIPHALKYKVFSLLFDLSNLDALERRLKLFSRNRFNLLSLYDQDFGNGDADLLAYLKDIAAQSEIEATITRFSMLAYPRILGFAFNPLTVYFGYDAHDRVCLVIYEVNNTFGERKSYVLPAFPDADGLIWQQCPKQLYVSPFNAVDGTYSFHITPLEEQLTIGVALKDAEGAKLRAHFHGMRESLSDKNLVWALARTGWMTINIVAGIHWEALKLWLKGMKLVPQPKGPDQPVSIFNNEKPNRQP